MAPLSDQDDPLQSYLHSTPNSSACSGTLHSPPTKSPSCPLSPTLRNPSSRQMSLSRTSRVNPFYGYPVTYAGSASTPVLRHGRRRKRDPLRTLVQLWWKRWKMEAVVSFILLALLLLALARKGLWSRRWRWRLARLPALPPAVGTLAIL